uniref:Acyl-coenzyme A thioesterase 1-like n=1 Tax=Scophthalmus maximus TaxID=52904 RepID=A0A8D3CIR7_SCOMX
MALLPSARCLFDEPLRLTVAGLRSRQLVALRALATDDKGVAFSSSATYRADAGGDIDLARDPSLSGSYVGVEPAGLLWSLRPDVLHTRFHKNGEGEGEGRMLAQAAGERRLIADGVGRRPVKEGNVRGVLFTPPGGGPFPAVLDLYTLGGGLSEKRASLLASRGFVVLTVALYGHDDMPKNIKEVHLDYFEEAIRFLKKQDKVGSKGVGVISLSKSGDLALSIASFLPDVEATVWINGCSANTVFPLYYKKKLILPPINENKATVVPIERAKGRFLFVAAEDDLNWDSKAYVDEMVERLQRHGKENFESVIYPGAGHYLEPPYGPNCPSSFHGAHAAAEVHLWKKIQEFFRTHLSCGAAQTRAKL